MAATDFKQVETGATKDLETWEMQKKTPNRGQNYKYTHTIQITM